MLRRKIYTIGYERRPVPAIIQFAQRLKVTHVVDVRSRASGRYAAKNYRPWVLSARLESAGVKHLHVPAVGVPWTARKEQQAEGHAGYRELVKSLLDPHDVSAVAATVRPMAVAISVIVGLVAEGDILLMGKERKAEQCHRLALAEELALAVSQPGVIEVTVEHF